MIKYKYKKIKKRIWEIAVDKIFGIKYNLVLYKSYWHSIISIQNTGSSQEQYLGIIPNEGAGIGHQMSNWMAGYYFARKFQLNFLHFPFTDEKWESLLNFGEGETVLCELQQLNYKIIQLPKFNTSNINVIRKIIASYNGYKILFLLERDQFCLNIAQTMDVIRTKFYAKNRIDSCPESKINLINIGIHIRRGDIVAGNLQNNNLKIRWLDNVYYYDQLTNYINRYLNNNVPYTVTIYSQGDKKDFEIFKDVKGIEFYLNEDPYSTFLQMTKADVLITSRSSFSFNAALLNKGIKICPDGFWHTYPRTKDWIIV